MLALFALPVKVYVKGMNVLVSHVLNQYWTKFIAPRSYHNSKIFGIRYFCLRSQFLPRNCGEDIFKIETSCSWLCNSVI